MAGVSVAEAAKKLQVSVPRVHKRIAEGSLRAERVGSQWLVDELSILRAAEHNQPGRPLSPRSAWALIALADGDSDALAEIAPSERARAKARLADLLALAEDGPKSEDDVRRVASALRSLFRNRAIRELHQAAPSDLEELRSDLRWVAIVSPAASGIASPEVDGYVQEDNARQLKRDFLLMPVDRDANVVVHVLPKGQKPYADSKLRLAADLADHRGPREELRAAQLLWEIAQDQRAAHKPRSKAPTQ